MQPCEAAAAAPDRNASEGAAAGRSLAVALAGREALAGSGAVKAPLEAWRGPETPGPAPMAKMKRDESL